MDPDLRALEARFRASPTPAARVGLARALERAGRRDEAYALLAGAPFEPEVLPELARYPAWTQVEADAGGARWLDVAPVDRAPRVRWRVDLERDALGLIAATPWGVVVTAWEKDGYGRDAYVLAPDTGEVRLRVRQNPEVLGVLAGVLLTVVHGESGRSRALEAFDLRLGEPLWSWALGENPTPGLARDALVVGDVGGVGGAPVTFVPLGDARSAPVSPGAWRDVRVAAITPARAYVLDQRRARGGRLQVLHRAGGAVTPWPGEAGVLRADDAGALVTGRHDDPGVWLHAPDGATTWHRPDLPIERDALLAPEHVAVWSKKRPAAAVLRRATGEQVAALPGLVSSAAGARDWLYACAASRTLVGLRLDGGASWTHQLDDDGLEAVVVAPGRVHTLTEHGVVTCLEPG